MSIKRISRRRVVAPIAEYVEEPLATAEEGRRTPVDDKHAPDKHAPDRHAPDRHAPGRGPSSPDPARASVPTNKFAVPTTKATVPTNKFSV